MTSLLRLTPVLGAILLTAGTLRANDAQAILYAESVRLHPATLKQFELTYTLEATTAFDGSINDEIGISDNPDATAFYATTFVLTDPTFGAMGIYCDLDLPGQDGKPYNGIADFFEVRTAVVNATSAAEFVLDDGMDVYPGTVDMTWNRAAGTASGTCKVRLRILDLGVDLTFTHAFEIYDYRGTYRYQVRGQDVTGTLTLTREGVAGSQSGALPLVRIDPNELQYPAFTLTNEVDQVIQFYSSEDMEISLLRGGMGTNYYTILVTDDGWPATEGMGEYMIWLLHVFDANDSDQDGLADLSDDPAPAAPPRLAITMKEKTVRIEVQAEPGQSATLEQTPSVSMPAWTDWGTFTLATATHVLELPAPAGPMFWRVRVE